MARGLYSMVWRQPGWNDVVGLLLVILIAPAMGGCFLAPWSPDRPPPAALSSMGVYVEGCETCHAADVSPMYPASTHGARGIRCGQCHRPGEHPDFAHPVSDATCGGCHSAEYEQTLASRHFATRVQRSLDTDRAARVALRRAQFVVRNSDSGRFAGDATAGERGGRLCVACHYDEHRFGRERVTREDGCTTCHAGREEHYPVTPADGTNRCTQCHVRVGETVAGLTVNTHRFAVPGTEGRAP